MTETTVHTKKVLLVDDEEFILDMLAEIIEQRNEMKQGREAPQYQVFTTSRSQQALDLIKREQPDVIVSDIRMPDIDGIDLLREVNQAGLSLPVIMVTGDPSDDTVLEALKHGAYSYLTKPIDPKQFLDRIAHALKNYSDLQRIRVLSALENWIEIEIRLCLNPRSLYDFFSRLQQGFKPQEARLIGYAFEELLMNAIEWGNKYDPGKKVRVSYIQTEKMVEYRIRDEGEGFDLKKLEHAAINEDDPINVHKKREKMGLRVGGFGLKTATHAVDEILYNEQGNEVVLIKYK